MIQLKDIKKVYKTKEMTTTALDGVSLDIEDGQMLAIMGPSGSGKSTLLNIIGAMDNLTEGSYRVNDTEVGTLKGNKLHEFRKNNISFVFQDFALMTRYTVYENVELPLLAGKKKRSERKKIVKEKLELMGIADLAKKYPTQISGGQQQRCAIARALASGNDIILADEPTGALDQNTGHEIMEAFKKVNELGKTVIIVTHDPNVAAYCNKTIHIVDGKIEEEKQLV